MTRKYPAPYVVAGWLPPEDAAAGLGKRRRALLERLARALALSDDYALAEIIERDGSYIQCGLASASDAAELADAVSAIDAGSRSAWARHWRFRFDEAAATRDREHAGSPRPRQDASASGRQSGIGVLWP